MQKQFQILEQLHQLSKETETKIKALREQIEEEFRKLKASLVNAYDYSQDIMYLVEFGSYNISFYIVTKERLYEINLSWYNTTSKKGYKYPYNYEEAVLSLKEYNSPTNCEICWIEFGYLDDIKRNYLREDWIAEKIHERKYFYEITESDFHKAVKTVSEFFGVSV
jgi:hypothetical protein